jgi:hypothetical protein
VGVETNGHGDPGGPERKVSRAEVLVLAKRRIKALEQTKQSLEGDKNILLEDAQRVKAA